MYNSSPRSCMTGSTMRGWRASFAKGVLYMCAAKFVRTEPRHFFDKHLDLIRSEQARKEKIAVAFEMLDFLRAELHREISLLDSGRAMSGVTSAPSRGGKAARAACRPLPDYRPENARLQRPPAFGTSPTSGAARGVTTWKKISSCLIKPSS